ncbi:MAG: nucleoside triphosphate pyrophosphohydrolase [Thermoanaerobacteraceae bacterium]|nr:nucleoside triphosphate pyrophosphohydrolase [Thermoanaerobacteraceae bacterium]
MEPRCYLAGLGPGNPDDIPPALWKLLEGPSRTLYLRTARHPAVRELERRGVTFTAFDSFYEEARSFAEVYARIARTVLEAAGKGEVIYAVPGHPLVAETSVQMILEEAGPRGVKTTVIPALSFLDALFAALHLDPARGVVVLDALNLDLGPWDGRRGLILTQVYSRYVAGQVKLALMEFLPDEHPVTVVRAAGVPGEERIEGVPLYELDRLPWIDHLTSIYVAPYPDADKYTLEGLADIMARLRGPDGCPWDKQQNHHSLKRYLLEETYEVLEALEEGDMHKLCEELGDLLLQIVFHARLAEEEGHFKLADVVRGIARKMIRRHPHVFGTGEARTAEQVLENWAKIKAAERKEEGREVSLLNAPKGLPALLKALKIQEQAARLGFDWPEVKEVWIKVEEELDELKRAVQKGTTEKIGEEVGDALFALVNLARRLQVEPEGALNRAIDKFCHRFRYMEEAARREGRDLATMELEEMDELWEEAKKLRETRWQ